MSTLHSYAFEEPVSSLITTQYELVKADSDYKLRNNQINDCIIYDNVFFKSVTEDYFLSKKIKEPDLIGYFRCTHCQNGCKAFVKLYKNGRADLINDHKNDYLHTTDIFRYERYLFKCHCIDELKGNMNASQFQIITNYLKKNSVSEFSPHKQYMEQVISKLKLKQLGKIPNKVSEIKIDILQTIGEQIDVFEIPFEYKGVETKIIIFIDSNLLRLFNSFSFSLLCDGTFSCVPQMYKQLFVVHALLPNKAFPFLYALCPCRTKNMY